ncbi:MAG: hypothetical protein ACON47_08855 [Flavobacteriaceae bacterium]
MKDLFHTSGYDDKGWAVLKRGPSTPSTPSASSGSSGSSAGYVTTATAG